MITKRLFDIFFSILGLIVLSWILLISFIMASIDTHSNGIFKQKRIGQYGKPFTIFKLKTVHPTYKKVTALGIILRQYKIDELPQLYNVLIGNMSIVGPRPDIAGYYDQLQGEDRRILALKPGITCLASLKYFNEEALLSKQENPLHYNNSVIFPDKVKMNLDYYYHRSFWNDLKIIYQTFIR